MKFIDEARIEVHAGKGGDGVAHFRREKFVPRGGQDGGDGGHGGSIYAVANRNINTLIDYRYARIHRARGGENGRGSDQCAPSCENDSQSRPSCVRKSIHTRPSLSGRQTGSTRMRFARFV